MHVSATMFPASPAPWAVEVSALTVTIPSGSRGRLRWIACFGDDRFEIHYGKRSRRARGRLCGPEGGAGAVSRLLGSGIWELRAYNRTRRRFEPLLGRGRGLLPAREEGMPLGATTRFSAERKTCVVVERILEP